MSTTVLATIGTGLALKAFERIIAAVAEAIPSINSVVKRKRANNLAIRQLYKKFSDVRMVKTIWQVDKAVDIKEFYYPTQVVIEQSARRVHSLEDLPDSRAVVLQGTIGQGKSIFLRYLCATELQLGKRLPIFIELRSLTKELDLSQLILRALTDLGLRMSEADFRVLAAKSPVVLLLDGFDELDPDLTSRTIGELESLVRQLESLRVLVTSRPDNAVQRSNAFRVLELGKLTNKDIPNMISMLMGVSKTTDGLIRAVTHKHSITKDLLTTPLMVTLLVITYKAEQRIPETMSDFFDGLFELLLSRHDRTKPGYKRHRACDLGNRDMRRVFENLAYRSRILGTRSAPTKKYVDMTEQSIKSIDAQADPEEYLADIRRVTGLLVEEGGHHNYIHKSVQEYYCASYIRSRPDHQARAFYERMAKQLWPRFDQELSFLMEIDAYRFSRYFLLADIGNTMQSLGVNSLSDAELSVASLQKIFDQIGLGISFDDGTLAHVRHAPEQPIGWTWRRTRRTLISAVLHNSLDSKFVEECTSAGCVLEAEVRLGKTVRQVAVGELLRCGVRLDMFRSLAKGRLTALAKYKALADSQLRSVDSVNSLLELDGISLNPSDFVSLDE